MKITKILNQSRKGKPFSKSYTDSIMFCDMSRPTRTHGLKRTALDKARIVIADGTQGMRRGE